ncbi:MAG: PKD domain-containing protein, partial [Verrucomicrobiota bacterium]
MNPPSMGCDEYHIGSDTNRLVPNIGANFTNVTTGFEIEFTATVEGNPSGIRWDFGDGTLISNQFLVSHTWTSIGDYSVQLTAMNEGFLDDVSTTLLVRVVSPPVHYVSRASTSPSPPYLSWSTAATSIQDAIDVADTAGAVVLVSNGIYDVGGRVANGSLSNRVVVHKPVKVLSVNGPETTVIEGAGPDGAIMRCAWLTNHAVLDGITLRNGHTLSGTGSNVDFEGGGCWMQPQAALMNCELVENVAEDGGGVYGGILRNCELRSNRADIAGGAYRSVLYNCQIVSNRAQSIGGVRLCTVYDSMLVRNEAEGGGGGAAVSDLINCILLENRAGSQGGGVSGGTLKNCALTANTAGLSGGGAELAALINCTVTGNRAALQGGGVSRCAVTNSILYYNHAPFGSNYSGESVIYPLNYSCTTPLPIGLGNISDEPGLASFSHLGSHSPCIGAGVHVPAVGTDIDGEVRAVPPSIGCDEYWTGAVTGALRVAMIPSYTSAAVGFELNFIANIEGRTTLSRWDFGDGTVISNRPYVSYTWASPGDYPVTLTAWNESFPGGVSTHVVVSII